MSPNNLPRVRANVDTRGEYERQLAEAIERRREVARKQLEQMEEKRNG